MAGDERFRTTVRLRINQGSVILRHGGIPAITTTLLDLSEGGCRCIVPAPAFETPEGPTWKSLLRPGTALDSEIFFEPHLAHFGIRVQIRALSAMRQEGIELGVSFVTPTAEQKAQLTQAMMSVAMDKVRQATAAKTGAQQVFGRTPTAADAPRRPPTGPNTLPMPVPVPPSALPPAIPVAPPAAAPATASYVPAPPVRPAFEAPQSHGVLEPNLRSVSGAWAPTSQSKDPKKQRLGEVLIQMGKLPPAKVNEAVRMARMCGLKLGQYLVREGVLTNTDLSRALAIQSGLPTTELADVDIPAPLGRLFPLSTMVHHRFIPFDLKRNHFCVAAAHPLSPAIIGELEASCGKSIEVFLAQEETVRRQLDKLAFQYDRHKRQFMRYKASVPIHYQFCERDGSNYTSLGSSGSTVDVSEGGFRIKGGGEPPEQLTSGALCMEIIVPFGGEEISCICDVRYLKKGDDAATHEKSWAYGVQIIKMDDTNRQKLKDFVLSVRRIESKSHLRATR